MTVTSEQKLGVLLAATNLFGDGVDLHHTGLVRFLQSIADVSVEFDPDDRIVDVSPKIETALGIRPGDFVGHRYREHLLSCDMLARFRAIAQRKSYILPVAYRTPRGIVRAHAISLPRPDGWRFGFLIRDFSGD